jgi:hypothetical protein
MAVGLHEREHGDPRRDLVRAGGRRYDEQSRKREKAEG